MTCLVALRSKAGSAVLFSDSQASSLPDHSERHGTQKQVVGDGFLLAVAGAADVAHAVLELVTRLAPKGRKAREEIKKFVVAEVAPEAASQFECIFVDSDGISNFVPSRFRDFRPCGDALVVGSGARFVSETWHHDSVKGLVQPSERPSDLLVRGRQAMAAADRSLTVDNKLLVGILLAGRSYLLGDDIQLQHADSKLHALWPEAPRRSKEILALASAIDGEVAEAHRIFAKLRIGELAVPDWKIIHDASKAVGVDRDELDQKIVDYTEWYDKAARSS
jgi:hypothetical protein